uniref:Uncharacterized protein n=1 Tax=Theropithecus gelada TaxID=9565 RepID=A0A8D2EJ65_THEGE
MLGIGDIVMPGHLLCFDLRYDNYKKQARVDSCGGPGPANISGHMQKVFYFHCTLMGYFVDLLTATVASHIHQAAQPALLCLVPFTLLPLLMMYLKGDLRWMWSELFHSKTSKLPIPGSMMDHVESDQMPMIVLFSQLVVFVSSQNWSGIQRYTC